MRLDPVSFRDVVIDDSFWSPRIVTNREKTLPHGFKMLEEHGYVENFQRAGDRENGGFRGLVYQDSDAYKLLQSAAASLTHPNEELQAEFDRWVDLIEGAQEDDGYLNTHFQLKMPDKKWANLRDWHELYCAGHLMEAAVTSGGKLMDVACKLADHIDRRFGPDKTPGYPGHPELELALIALYRATGEKKYYDLARHFTRERGTHYFAQEHGTPEEEYDGTYWQDRIPIAEVDVIEGHAVRALYLLCAATDIVRESGDKDLESMIHRVWDNAVNKRSYVTGGLGNSAKNEGFTNDYDLPNDTAYQETCASIAMVFWAHRMALLYGDAKYADVMETALYNGVLSGISLSGTKFFYENPLASDGTHHRQDWYACACCPPNISRLLSMLGEYAYAQSDGELYINLFMSGSVNGTVIETDYPRSGKIRITPANDKPIHIRIPGWCERERSANGYETINHNGEPFEIEFEMPVRQIAAHPMVTHNAGRIALARGPIIYCLEQCDNKHNIMRLSIDKEAPVQVEFDASLGCVTLKLQMKEAASWQGDLYGKPTTSKPVTAKAIPYCLWDNREPGAMLVWIPIW